MELYPMVFDLAGMTQQYLWGGQQLQKYDKPGTAGEPLAEVWEVSERPSEHKVSVVGSGPLTGRDLSWLTTTYPIELLGYVPESGKFPLLVKFLDAAKDLSLQVHPPASVAAQLHGEPKTEAWVGLGGSAVDASVFAGFSRAVTVDELRVAIATDQLEPLLHRLPFGDGDALLIPAGRIHGINAGCLLLEVQQSSDTTYRVYDYGRIDPKTNKPRELKIEQALASLDLMDVQPSLAAPRQLAGRDGVYERLIQTEFFRIERWRPRSQLVSHDCHDCCTVVVNVGDSPLELTAASASVTLSELGICLVPAATGRYEIARASSYLTVTIPHPQR